MATEIEVTGDWWQDKDSDEPWAVFDTDAELTIPISFDRWIADPDASIVIATAKGYNIFTIVATPDNRHVVVEIKIKEDAQYVKEIKYPFSIKWKDSNGDVDERTWYLLLKDR